MTVEEFTEALSEHTDDHLQFERVEKKRSTRPDLHAFLLLAELDPSSKDIVGGAEHDEIFLNVDIEAVARSSTLDTITELRRCGVMYDEDSDSLAMFV